MAVRFGEIYWICHFSWQNLSTVGPVARLGQNWCGSSHLVEMAACFGLFGNKETAADDFSYI